MAGHRIIYTKSFNSDLRSLLSKGQKRAAEKARSALTEAGMVGEISLPRTKNGENRLPNVEKYDLGDGFRLVVQLVDGVAKHRAFLFAGSHDESSRWLDSHRNYRWVTSPTDGTLEFVQVTERINEKHIPADRVDLDAPVALLHLPLFRALTEDQWKVLDLPPSAREYVGRVTAESWERDAESIFSRLTELTSYDQACFVLDLLHHANGREWSQLDSRLQMRTGEMKVASDAEALAAMLSPVNSESFITFDDEGLASFLADKSLADWMLFLHPEQRKLATKDFNGPARLRGVSGSGKTCVLVHRARYLAKKYRQPVLLVTLTESMRKLLEHLRNELCGVEATLIETATVASIARDVVEALDPKAFRAHLRIPDGHRTALLGRIKTAAKQHPEFAKSTLAQIEEHRLQEFLEDEVSYLRGRLRPKDFDRYLDKSFARRGRGFRLQESGRKVCLESGRYWVAELARAHQIDHEGIVALGLDLLEASTAQFQKYRCVLADEVQDLSQLELELLGRLHTPEGELLSKASDGIFLCGDGAQTIWAKGFTLKRAGLDVNNRSFALRKSYRNTYEILSAAFGLVEQYEFADVDEENVAKPTAPEWAKRHGRRPMIVRFRNAQEAQGIAQLIRSLVEQGHTPGQICVISASGRTRDDIQDALGVVGVPWVSLRDNVDYESDRVKVSTIESAKGHEFGTVFIAGVVETVIPKIGVVADEDISREAARLYVAMTRARETLYLTYALAGKPASRFLTAIQGQCDEMEYSQGVLLARVERD